MKRFSIDLPEETPYTLYMMKNDETIQATAKQIAAILLRGTGPEEVSMPEHIQYLLSYTVDQRYRYPFAAAIAEETLQCLFEALEPEQVIL